MKSGSTPSVGRRGYLDQGKEWLTEVMPADADGSQDIDLAPRLCGPRTCPARMDDVIAFADVLHLSATMSAKRSPLFARPMFLLEEAAEGAGRR